MTLVLEEIRVDALQGAGFGTLEDDTTMEEVVGLHDADALEDSEVEV